MNLMIFYGIRISIFPKFITQALFYSSSRLHLKRSDAMQEITQIFNDIFGSSYDKPVILKRSIHGLKPLPSRMQKRFDLNDSPHACGLDPEISASRPQKIPELKTPQALSR